MEDELEALLAVYGDITTVLSRNDQTVLTMNLQPRFSSSVSFVAAHCNIVLHARYPDVPPVVNISQTSGLWDEGKALRRYAAQQLQELFLPGECILFQLIDALLDYLDEHNTGSCMICFDDLSCGTVTAPVALKTTCLHCFHLSCLCYWVQVCATTQEQSISAQQQREKEDVAYRSLLGELRSEENRLTTLQQEQQHLQHTLDSLQESFASVRRMGELEVSIAASKAQISALNGKKTKNKRQNDLGFSEELMHYESELQTLQASLGDIDAAALRKKEIDIHQKLDAVTVSIDKCVRKVETCQQKVTTELSRMEHQQSVANSAPISFPCPCCRSTLCTDSLVLAHQEAHLQKCMRQAESDYQATGRGNNTSCGDVSSLSEELKLLVADIQRKQAAMRVSMKSTNCFEIKL